MIEKGKVGPGATIAIKSDVTSSGYHAKTLIGVNYDENGKLKSYVLQGNNRNSLEVISYPQPKKYNNVYAGDMNRWMNNQLEKEAVNAQVMTTEQLEARVAQEKDTVNKRIDELAKTEESLFKSHPNNVMVNDYADWYIKNANVPDATRCVMQADRGNADKKSEALVQLENANVKSGTANTQTQMQTPQTQKTAEKQQTGRKLPFTLQKVDNIYGM